VVVTATGFSTQARFTGKAWGVENLRIAEYPGPLGIHDSATIARNVETVLFDSIVKGLTTELESADAKSALRLRGQRDIVCTGTADEVNRFFAANDGLTDCRSCPRLWRGSRIPQIYDAFADEEIAVLPSANLRATPWNIAVNAVMAGCLLSICH
jgi:hypothetical protein